jgi:hypothetical protein
VKNKENAEKADVRHRVVPAPDPGYAVHPENQRKPSAVPPNAKSDSKISMRWHRKIATWVPLPL